MVYQVLFYVIFADSPEYTGCDCSSIFKTVLFNKQFSLFQIFVQLTAHFIPIHCRFIISPISAFGFNIRIIKTFPDVVPVVFRGFTISLRLWKEFLQKCLFTFRMSGSILQYEIRWLVGRYKGQNIFYLFIL